ncbi:MAG: glutamine amidotransferase [Candidatus Peregrinibacteria bacterium Greene0416_62]|nr:MAG: glutamine amidotransferase [Candidatus Peregrinibacteria bacterium Greene0416_62]TSC97483.1 MAG: glutamine amidotransferase [Candidatus Peregrinibacteria bacterium Greene1014_49]
MIVIVDYGLGNLFSVQKAFEMIGADVKISGTAEDIHAADRIVLPGVGAFGDGMDVLREKGLDRALTEEVINKKKPFLGICLGLQFLAETGEEHGEHKGLGWIKGRVRKLDVEKQGLKVPHIGWNELSMVRESPLFADIKSDADFYFVHSYQLDCGDPQDLIATAEYGEKITAAVQRGNIFATQFHPEKSQDNGLKLLENFIRWNP